MIDLKNMKKKFFNNRKVAENYFFMTFLQGANLLIGLLLYPYLIRVLGKEAYGTYILIFSNVQFFTIFVSFGFALPALKKISLSPNDNEVKNQTISEVFTAKIYLFALSAVVLVALIFIIPFVYTNAFFYVIIFTTLLIDILFPSWYFQGIQKMKFVTYVNLASRILTIPVIFIFIKSSADLLKYTLIVSLFPIAGSIYTFFYLQIKENVTIRLIAIKNLKPVFKEAIPFFWISAVNTLKANTVTSIIGIFFNLKEVAIWDLANKIVLIPRTITMSINSAIFPNIVSNFNPSRVKKVINYNRLISIVVSLLVAALGYWAVLVLGGRDMLAAYPVAIVLSFTIYTWLVVGTLINMVFVARGKYKFVTMSYTLAFLFFIPITAIGMLIYKNIINLAVALVVSDLLVGLYCHYIIKKYEMLKKNKNPKIHSR